VEVSPHLEHAERIRDGTDHPLVQHVRAPGARKDPASAVQEPGNRSE
jgi:hypothetical protein